MDEFLRSPLFRVAVGLLIAGALLKVAWKYLFPPAPALLRLKVRCQGCGWTGLVGKYNRKCARCAGTTLKEAP